MKLVVAETWKVRHLSLVVVGSLPSSRVDVRLNAMDAEIEAIQAENGADLWWRRGALNVMLNGRCAPDEDVAGASFEVRE